MLAQPKSSCNVLVLLDSIRRFVDELEGRNDPVEIKDWEETMWELALVHDMRRHKAPAPKLPMVTKWRSE